MKNKYFLKCVGLLSLTLFSYAATAENVRFSEACSSARDQLVIAGVGDILPHKPLLQQSSENGSYIPFWQNVMPTLGQADVIYANLETPLAPGVVSSGREVRDPGFVYDDYVYTNVPMLNAHPQLAYDLVRSGFDVVSTANNHSMDRGSLGVDRTIETLRQAGLPFTGTRHSREDTPWYTFVDKRGWRLAFLACSFSTNGNADPKNQVLGCFSDKSELLALVKSLSSQRDVDAVIVTPHWGNSENTQWPDGRNKDLGRQLLEAGATAVIGTHPHWIQPWEKYKTSDGREGLIVYSTGNFVSNQPWTYNRMGMAVFVGLSRDSSGRVWVNGARYHLMRMVRWPHRLDSLTQSNDPEAGALWRRAYDLLGKERVLKKDETVVTNIECF